MTKKEFMLSCLHRFHRGDPWVNELYKAIEIDLDNIDKKLRQDYDNLFFDTMSVEACRVLEKVLGIRPNIGATLEDRRKRIAVRWLAKSRATIPIFQAMADIYYDSAMTVKYNGDAKLIFDFQQTLGGTLFTQFLEGIEEIKPAWFDMETVAHFNIPPTMQYVGAAVEYHKDIEVSPKTVEDSNLIVQYFAGGVLNIHKEISIMPKLVEDTEVKTNIFMGAGIRNQDDFSIMPKLVEDTNVKTNIFMGAGIRNQDDVSIMPKLVEDTEVGALKRQSAIPNIHKEITIMLVE